jgi:hypothetical protein
VVVLSYVSVFWIALACQAAAVVIVVFAVDEPRRRQASPNER